MRTKKKRNVRKSFDKSINRLITNKNTYQRSINKRINKRRTQRRTKKRTKRNNNRRLTKKGSSRVTKKKTRKHISGKIDDMIHIKYMSKNKEISPYQKGGIFNPLSLLTGNILPVPLGLPSITSFFMKNMGTLFIKHAGPLLLVAIYPRILSMLGMLKNKCNSNDTISVNGLEETDFNEGGPLSLIYNKMKTIVGQVNEEPLDLVKIKLIEEINNLRDGINELMKNKGDENVNRLCEWMKNNSTNFRVEPGDHLSLDILIRTYKSLCYLILELDISEGSIQKGIDSFKQFIKNLIKTHLLFFFRDQYIDLDDNYVQNINPLSSYQEKTITIHLGEENEKKLSLRREYCELEWHLYEEGTDSGLKCITKSNGKRSLRKLHYTNMYYKKTTDKLDSLKAAVYSSKVVVQSLIVSSILSSITVATFGTSLLVSPLILGTLHYYRRKFLPEGRDDISPTNKIYNNYTTIRGEKDNYYLNFKGNNALMNFGSSMGIAFGGKLRDKMSVDDTKYKVSIKRLELEMRLCWGRASEMGHGQCGEETAWYKYNYYKCHQSHFDLWSFYGDSVCNIEIYNINGGDEKWVKIPQHNYTYQENILPYLMNDYFSIKKQGGKHLKKYKDSNIVLIKYTFNINNNDSSFYNKTNHVKPFNFEKDEKNKLIKRVDFFSIDSKKCARKKKDIDTRIKTFIQQNKGDNTDMDINFANETDISTKLRNCHDKITTLNTECIKENSTIDMFTELETEETIYECLLAKQIYKDYGVPHIFKNESSCFPQDRFYDIKHENGNSYLHLYRNTIQDDIDRDIKENNEMFEDDELGGKGFHNLKFKLNPDKIKMVSSECHPPFYIIHNKVKNTSELFLDIILEGTTIITDNKKMINNKYLCNSIIQGLKSESEGTPCQASLTWRSNNYRKSRVKMRDIQSEDIDNYMNDIFLSCEPSADKYKLTYKDHKFVDYFNPDNIDITGYCKICYMPFQFRIRNDKVIEIFEFDDNDFTNPFGIIVTNPDNENYNVHYINPEKETTMKTYCEEMNNSKEVKCILRERNDLINNIYKLWTVNSSWKQNVGEKIKDILFKMQSILYNALDKLEEHKKSKYSDSIEDKKTKIINMIMEHNFKSKSDAEVKDVTELKNTLDSISSLSELKIYANKAGINQLMIDRIDDDNKLGTITEQVNTSIRELGMEVDISGEIDIIQSSLNNPEAVDGTLENINNELISSETEILKNQFVQEIYIPMIGDKSFEGKDMEQEENRKKLSDMLYRYISTYLQLSIDIFDELLWYPPLKDILPTWTEKFQVPSINICKEINEKSLCYSRNLIYNNLKDYKVRVNVFKTANDLVIIPPSLDHSLFLVDKIKVVGFNSICSPTKLSNSYIIACNDTIGKDIVVINREYNGFKIYDTEKLSDSDAICNLTTIDKTKTLEKGEETVREKSAAKVSAEKINEKIDESMLIQLKNIRDNKINEIKKLQIELDAKNNLLTNQETTPTDGQLIIQEIDSIQLEIDAMNEEIDEIQIYINREIDKKDKRNWFQRQRQKLSRSNESRIRRKQRRKTRREKMTARYNYEDKQRMDSGKNRYFRFSEKRKVKKKMKQERKKKGIQQRRTISNRIKNIEKEVENKKNKNTRISRKSTKTLPPKNRKKGGGSIDRVPSQIGADPLVPSQIEGNIVTHNPLVQSNVDNDNLDPILFTCNGPNEKEDEDKQLFLRAIQNSEASSVFVLDSDIIYKIFSIKLVPFSLMKIYKSNIPMDNVDVNELEYEVYEITSNNGVFFLKKTKTHGEKGNDAIYIFSACKKCNPEESDIPKSVICDPSDDNIYKLWSCLLSNMFCLDSKKEIIGHLDKIFLPSSMQKEDFKVDTIISDMSFSSIHSSIAINTFLHLYKHCAYNRGSYNDKQRVINMINEKINELISTSKSVDGVPLKESLHKLLISDTDDNYLIKYGIPKTLFRKQLIEKIKVDKLLLDILLEEYQHDIYSNIQDNTKKSIIELCILEILDPDPDFSETIQFTIGTKTYHISLKDLLFDLESELMEIETPFTEKYTKYTCGSREFYGPIGIDLTNMKTNMDKCKLLEKYDDSLPHETLYEEPQTSENKIWKTIKENNKCEKDTEGYDGLLNNEVFITIYSKLLQDQQDFIKKRKEELSVSFYEDIYALNFISLDKINKVIKGNLLHFKNFYSSKLFELTVASRPQDNSIPYLSSHDQFNNNPDGGITPPQKTMVGSLETSKDTNTEYNPLLPEPVTEATSILPSEVAPDIKPTADELLTDDPTDIMKKNILDDPFSSSYNSQIPIGTFFKVSEKIKIEEVKKAMDKGAWCADILKGTYDDDDDTIRDAELIYKEYLGDPSQLHKMEIQVDEKKRGNRGKQNKCRQKDNDSYNNQIYVRFINTPEAQKNGKKHHASIYINPQSIILDSSKQTTEVIE